MKKIMFSLLAAATVFALTNCKSIETSTVGGKEITTASVANPVIFTAWGSPLKTCVDELEKAGATNLVAAEGGLWGGAKIGTGGLYSSSRLSSTEFCRATGTK